MKLPFGWLIILHFRFATSQQIQPATFSKWKTNLSLLALANSQIPLQGSWKTSNNPTQITTQNQKQAKNPMFFQVLGIFSGGCFFLKQTLGTLTGGGGMEMLRDEGWLCVVPWWCSCKPASPWWSDQAINRTQLGGGSFSQWLVQWWKGWENTRGGFWKIEAFWFGRSQFFWDVLFFVEGGGKIMTKPWIPPQLMKETRQQFCFTLV